MPLSIQTQHLLSFPRTSGPFFAALPVGIPHLRLIPGQRGTIRFTESPIQSSDPVQVRYRIMAAEDPPPYDVSKETYEILLPEGCGNSPSIPRGWDEVLARHGIIFIGATNSGNRRNIFDRIRLAIDANHNLRQRFAIDGRRVYVSGFSGGSRIASMLGVAWGDMFSGTICCMGVNFYTDVEAPDGKVYGLSYLPNEELLPLVKKACRFSLITGEKDFNLPNTKGAFENGFQKEAFENVQLLEIPGHGHKPPPADWLDKAIRFLDEGK
jgi:predicted esterase